MPSDYVRYLCYDDTTVPTSHRLLDHNYRFVKPTGQQPTLFTKSEFGETVDFSLALSKLNPQYVSISTAEKSSDKER